MSTKTSESVVRELFTDIREGHKLFSHPLREAVYKQVSPDEFILEVDEACYHFSSEFVCKQFCRAIKGFGFPMFQNNDPSLNVQIVETWLPELKCDSYHFLVTTLEDGTYSVQGMIPGDEAPIPILAVLDTFASTHNFDLHYWEEGDGDFFLRYLTGDSFEFDGRSWRHGLTVSFSDIGGTPLTVDHFVLEESSGLTFVVNYEGPNFLRTAYKGFDATALGEFWDLETQRFEGMDLNFILEGLQKSSEEIWTVQQTDKRLKEMGIWKGLSAKFAATLEDEIYIEGIESYLTSWALAKRISEASKKAEKFSEQVKIERVAGRVAGLIIPEIQGKKLFKDFLKGR